MTPDDRDLLLSLRRKQAELQHSLAKLSAQLDELEARADTTSAPEIPPLRPHSFPPLPVKPPLPSVPAPIDAVPATMPVDPAVAEVPLPPIPTAVHALPPVPTAPKPSFEFQFGRWLTRMGALFGVIALALIFSLPGVQALLGHAGLLALSAAASLVVVVLGDRMERKGAAALLFGRTIAAMALAWLYLTAYAAYFYEPLRVIHSPYVAGLLLLLWSFYVLRISERKKSQILALFAITLAYVSTAINPIGSFTMTADLILAATAMVFLYRNGWAGLSTFSLIGTYAALLRRLVVDENGEIVFDTSRTLHFLPYATYLVFAWLIFTTAVILTTSPAFRGGKRLAFLSLNNGALAGLLPLTAYIAGYGASAMGWTLLDAGLALLVTSRIAGFIEVEPVDVMSAYAAQGLALFTAGIMVIYTGITRGLLLLIETLFLGLAAAFSRDLILTVTTYVAAFFATLFLILEMAVAGHHPWLLGFGGAAVMLFNAWLSRADVRSGPGARDTVVVSASYYCSLALGLILTALCSALGDSTLPPGLALAALALTFSIYFVSLFELPPLAQSLLLVAQALVLFPAETGEELPWWTTACVAAATLLLVTWWPRQRVTRTGAWTITLTFIYALALAGLAHQEVRPYLDAQGWMIGASLLSVAFLIYGTFARVWPLAAVGQLFLVLALYHFFLPPNRDVFPWTWWAAAVPIMATFATARAAHEWLRISPEVSEPRSESLRLLAHGYQLVALVAVVRWVFAVIPPPDQIDAFLFLGTFILSWNVRHASSFGVRSSFVLSLFGVGLYLTHLPDQAHAMATYLNGLAMLLFLAQPALLHHEGKNLIPTVESWILVILSVGTGWIFISAWVWTRISPGYLTMGWALYALFLFLFGLLVRKNRMRWCGMAVLVAAILRVGFWDMWTFSLGYRVLTFVVLALITLGIGYILLRRSGSTTAASSEDQHTSPEN